MRPRRITLGRYLTERWLPAIAATIRPSTLVGYRTHVHRHIVPSIGHVPLRRIDGGILNSFYEQLARADGARLAPATIRRVHATLHRALRDAVRWSLIERNPAHSADPPKELAQSREMRSWTAAELRSFLASVRTDALYPLWLLLATTGMRRGEALGLRWGDIDVFGGTLSIRQTIISIGGRIEESTPKSARSRRVVALDECTVAVLARHRTSAAHSARSDLVFCRRDGSPLPPTGISKRFVSLALRAGLPRIRLHDLRHTHATLALQAGVHPKVVSERLGHSTVALTLDVYSHAIKSLQEEAAARVARLVFEDGAAARS